MKVAFATTLVLASITLCAAGSLFAAEPGCGWPAEPNCGCDVPNRPGNSCRCSKCCPHGNPCKKDHEAQAQSAPAEVQPPYAVPMTPQMFTAQPQIASVQQGGPGLGVGGGAISMPAISIGLPRLELPGFFRTRRQPRARVESSSAQFVGNMQAAAPVAAAAQAAPVAAVAVQAAPAATAQSACDCSQAVLLEKLMLIEKLTRLMGEDNASSAMPQSAHDDEKAELEKKIGDLEAKIKILTEHLEGTLKFKTSHVEDPNEPRAWPVQNQYPVQATSFLYQPTVCRTPPLPSLPLRAGHAPVLTNATATAPPTWQFSQPQFVAQSSEDTPHPATQGQWSRTLQPSCSSQAMNGVPDGRTRHPGPNRAMSTTAYPHSPSIISVRPVVRANGF